MAWILWWLLLQQGISKSLAEFRVNITSPCCGLPCQPGIQCFCNRFMLHLWPQGSARDLGCSAISLCCVVLSWSETCTSKTCLHALGETCLQSFTVRGPCSPSGFQGLFLLLCRSTGWEHRTIHSSFHNCVWCSALREFGLIKNKGRTCCSIGWLLGSSSVCLLLFIFGVEIFMVTDGVR